MQTIDDLQAWKRLKSSLCSDKSIGFVPTMGNLHAGHQSLLERSVTENDITVLSIYVNPTQFDQPTDYNTYPATIDRDLECARASGVDFVLLPRYEQMYPDAFRFKLTEDQFSLELEGMRAGHFTGVLTVVMKLLQLVYPDKAYFGEKDYQQYLLIRDMAAAFFMPIDIVACPTVRNATGLALSSRNQRLSQASKGQAAELYSLLQSCSSVSCVKAGLLQKGIAIDYVKEYCGRRYAAIVVEGVRLIDNVPVH
jgi:pantoate--beta-alanine ligase